MSNEEFKEFDENDAVEYINNVLTTLGKNAYDGDELLLLIDAMYDYYEENDSFDSDEDLEEDIDAITAYVKKTLAKDADCQIAPGDVRDIILAEMQYEDSLNN